jgi:hypothetical protein
MDEILHYITMYIDRHVTKYVDNTPVAEYGVAFRSY